MSVSKEEILKKYTGFSRNSFGLPGDNEVEYYHVDTVNKIMDECLSQTPYNTGKGNEDLAIEVLARFTGNSRGTPIAKNAFIDGANWMKGKLSAPNTGKPEAPPISVGDGWVRVEDDGYPEKNKGVLVFIPDEDYHITSGMWDIDNKWVLLDEYRVPECEVTHWMKLPEVPAEFEKEIGENFKVLKWLKEGIKSGDIKVPPSPVEQKLNQ